MSNNNSAWLELYKLTFGQERLLADKAWETIKFHILLSSSVISITIALLGYIQTLTLSEIIKMLLTGSVAILPYTMVRMLNMGSRNFRRECERLYEQITIRMKVEDKLDLRRERKEAEKKLFPGDEKYIPARWDEKKWQSSKQFVDDMLSCLTRNNFYCIMRPIFSIFRIVSYFLMAIIGLILLTLIFQIFL